MENKIRNTLNEIYFGKTRDIVHGLRSAVPLSQMKQRDLLKDDLASALRNRSQQSWIPPPSPNLLAYSYMLLLRTLPLIKVTHPNGLPSLTS